MTALATSSSRPQLGMRFGVGIGLGSRERGKWPVFTFKAMTKGWELEKNVELKGQEGKDLERG